MRGRHVAALAVASLGCSGSWPRRSRTVVGCLLIALAPVSGYAANQSTESRAEVLTLAHAPEPRTPRGGVTPRSVTPPSPRAAFPLPLSHLHHTPDLTPPYARQAASDVDDLRERQPAVAALLRRVAGPITGTVRSEAGNVRSSPEIAKNIIGTVHRGDELIFVGVSGDWYLVRLGTNIASTSTIVGQEGWVSKVVVNPPERVPPAAPSTPRSTFAWQTSSDAALIYQQDGALHFRVTKEQSQDGLRAQLEAQPSGPAIRTISFLVDLQWSQGHAPGAMVFHAELGDGRDLGLRIGPGEGYPWVDFLIDGKVAARGDGFPYQQPVRVHLTWTGQDLVVTLADEEHLSLPTQAPLQKVHFTLDAEGGCIFHAVVSELKVEYAK